MQYILSQEELDTLKTAKGQEELGRRVIAILKAIKASPKESMVSKFGLYESFIMEVTLADDVQLLSKILVAWEEAFLITKPTGVLKALKDC